MTIGHPGSMVVTSEVCWLCSYYNEISITIQWHQVYSNGLKCPSTGVGEWLDP